MENTIPLIALGIFLSGCLIGIWHDRRSYNDGICRNCGNKLKIFDMDSQGGRGYVCKNGHYTWVSWNVDGEYVE